MFEANAHLELLKLLRTGRLDLSPVAAKVYPMASVLEAMEVARKAGSLECVVVRN